MSCDPINFSNVSQAAFTCCAQTAAKYGVTINSNSGSGSSHGFTIEWNYDPASKTLMLHCTGKPFFIPCSAVNDHITDAVTTCTSSNP
jgi:hypothetical protein